MNSLDYQMVYLIIFFYFVTFCFWAIMAASHVKWGSKNSFSGVGMAVTFLYYGFRNYHYVFIEGKPQSGDVLWMNLLGITAFMVFSYFMANEYIVRIWKRFKK